MPETMRCAFCEKDVDPEGHRWECEGRERMQRAQEETDRLLAAMGRARKRLDRALRITKTGG